MFGFKKFINRQLRSNKENKMGVQLFAAILVCYPEIDSLKYEPREGKLTIDFILNKPVSREEVNEFIQLLNDSIQTYYSLEYSDMVPVAADVEVNCVNNTIWHIVRILPTVTRGELNLMVALFKDKYGEALRCDEHNLDILEPDFRDEQSQILDQLLEQTLVQRPSLPMIGLRDGEKVVVYNS